MSGKHKRRTARFTPKGIADLPKNKPVVYRVLSEGNKNLYTGIAKRGRVAQRLAEHLPGGKDPIRGGRKVRVDQQPSIEAARESEARIIKRAKPPQNKRGK